MLEYTIFVIYFIFIVSIFVLRKPRVEEEAYRSRGPGVRLDSASVLRIRDCRIRERDIRNCVIGFPSY